MDRKVSLSVSLAIAFLAMTVTFSVTMVVAMRIFDRTVNSVQQQQVLNDKLAEINKYVRGNYYGDVDEDYLSDRTARGFLDGLQDSRNVYYTAKEYNEMMAVENGTLVGIGVEVIRDLNGYYRVVKVYKNSPAEAEGIQVNFYISKIGDLEAGSITSLRTFQSLLRGNVGTELSLICLDGVEERAFTVQRINYIPPTVEYQLTEAGYGYVRVFSFGQNTVAEFDNAIRALEEGGAKAILFDVRGTSGRSYDQVYEMIGRVCPLGTIARGEYKGGIFKALATSNGETYLDLPMVVLVNEATAGPAELFAICLRDMAGAEVAGVKTAGDGMLLSPIQRLSDGSAISIIVAKIHVGSGTETYEGTGITPDIETSESSDNTAWLWNASFEQDPQLIRSMNLLEQLAKAAGLDSPPSQPDASLPPSGPEEEDDESLSGEEADSATA